MAFLLSSEQPTAVAVAVNPLGTVRRWFAARRAAHAQRLALSALLEFDASRLDDLGINRQDLFEAMRQSTPRPGETLAERRSRNSSDWLRRR